MPTKEIVADSLGTLDFEGMANLNCQINALSKMSRLSRQKANRNPPVPTSLKNLAISPSVRKWFKTIGHALPFMEPGSVVDVWTNDQ